MVLDRTIAPIIQDPVSFSYKLPPLQTVKLGNNIPLYWLSAGVQDVVEINWVFPAGIFSEAKPGVAQATAGQLKSGTNGKSAHQINEAVEFYGASLKVGAGNDHSTLTLHCLTKHLSFLLPIVFELITQASFPESELAIYKQNTIQRLAVSLRECEFVANQQMDVALFGQHHPYGRHTKKENIEALTANDLRTFHQHFYQLSTVQIFMSGKVGDTEVALINKFFGQPCIDFLAMPNPIAELSPSATNKIWIDNDPNGVQGAIRVGKRFVTRQHPDFAGLVVLNTVLGGYFGSRLMSNIREDKGFTYGIYSSIGAYKQDASLIIHTEVGKDVIAPALLEIYKELDLITKKLVAEDELLLVKNYLLGSILGDLDGPFSIMQRWRSLILNGFAPERFDENINTYKNITPSQLLTLAQEHYQSQDFIELVVV